MTISGLSDAASLSSGTVTTLESSNLTLTGTNDAISLAGSNTLTIKGSTKGDVVTISGTGDTVSATIAENAGASATVSGSSDRFIYTPSFGQDTLTGFNVSGTDQDIRQFSVADFNYRTSYMS